MWYYYYGFDLQEPWWIARPLSPLKTRASLHHAQVKRTGAGIASTTATGAGSWTKSTFLLDHKPLFFGVKQVVALNDHFLYGHGPLALLQRFLMLNSVSLTSSCNVLTGLCLSSSGNECCMKSVTSCVSTLMVTEPAHVRSWHFQLSEWGRNLGLFSRSRWNRYPLASMS